jgi:2-oxoglutarate ferredoxin oxidoreductase subunit beta
VVTHGRGVVPVVHDAHAADPSAAFALSRLDDTAMLHVPVGVFRSVDRPTYDDLVRGQVSASVEKAGRPASDDDLAALLAGSDTWRVD